MDEVKNKKVKKSLISILAFLLVVVALFSAQTYAFLTDSNSSGKNILTASKLDIELIEMQNTDNGQTTYVNPVAIMPATEVSKIVTVKNTGTLPVYLRIKIEKSINKPDDQLPDNWRDLISCNFNLDDPTTEEI